MARPRKEVSTLFLEGIEREGQRQRRNGKHQINVYQNSSLCPFVPLPLCPIKKCTR